MKPIHSVILTTTKRTNQTDNPGECWVSLDLNLSGEPESNLYIQLVSSSTISLNGPTDIVLISSTVRQPYSWDGSTSGESQILGRLAPTLETTGGMFLHMASSHDNQPVPCVIPKTGLVHLRLLDYSTGSIIKDKEFGIHLMIFRDA
jgi:hypothetical protein